MSFGWFLILGWIRIRCRHCSTRLALKAIGERFWTVLAGGAVAVVAILLFVDYPFRWIGETGTLILFLAVIVVTLLLSAYVVWKDSRFELMDRA